MGCDAMRCPCRLSKNFFQLNFYSHFLPELENSLETGRRKAKWTGEKDEKASNMAPIEAPQLAIPGEPSAVAPQAFNELVPATAAPVGSAKKSMDEKFDEALAFMGRHPVMSGVGGFLGLYFAAGAFKSVSRMMGGGPKAAQFAKGGFDPKMNTKEALQILNLSENNLNRKKLKEVHRRIMLANHPDKGGSPYLATKINEAKDFLEKRGLRK
ncbi:Pam18p [Lachancea thermotolerans CBS 6340]|uniref:Mitochondrial import inner membrane translocase subunit TIM14 n=1 Tax=Lachancea thermotolerans (strain ATCC 56472 / CBS 6340 / NRRL Y-8284) TaxID=559295 RepID=C5DCF5_LACTC|nr:KLTH0B02640p [Lachancea thermotolerans CBS 6340]CAR21466.1 KLTH0B02640p [Lachancea thermotolerans CBS 6340]